MQRFIYFILMTLVNTIVYQQTLYTTDVSADLPLDKHRLCLQKMVDVARWYCPEVAEIISKKFTELCEAKKNTPFNDHDYLNFTMSAQIHTMQYPDEMHGVLNLNTYYFSNTSMVLIPFDLSSQFQHNFIISPGYSHQRIDSLQQLFLERVCELSNTCQTLIQIADIGAGHGYVSRNALIAGGKHASSSRHSTKPLRGACVHAIEQHSPLIKTEQGEHGPLMFAFKRAKELSPRFNKTKALAKDYFSVISADACTVLNKLKYKNFFDLLYLGNMLHYCTPKQAQNLGFCLFDAAKEGAFIYASAHTDLFFPNVENNRVFECYKTQHEQGKKFPGWMMLNALAKIQGKHTYDSIFIQAWPLDEDNDEVSPAQQKVGWHKENSHASIMKIAENDFRAMSHQSYQIYDVFSLKALFERSGFVIEDAFFLNKIEERIDIGSIGTGDGRFSSAQETQQACRACVVARKPKL